MGRRRVYVHQRQSPHVRQPGLAASLDMANSWIRTPAVRLNRSPGTTCRIGADCCCRLAAELDGLLTIDFNLQEVLGKRGLPLLVEARARAAHQNFSNYVRDSDHRVWLCRLLAARRAENPVVENSGCGGSMHGFGAPIGSPAIRLARLLFGLRGRGLCGHRRPRSIPLIVGWYMTDAWASPSGISSDLGASEQQALRWELDEAREGERAAIAAGLDSDSCVFLRGHPRRIA